MEKRLGEKKCVCGCLICVCKCFIARVSLNACAQFMTVFYAHKFMCQLINIGNIWALANSPTTLEFNFVLGN